MQWVVTTGRTVDEAKARALDALGIDDADLELEVLAEPTSSIFGLRTTPATVRARVRPTRPRPKIDRRNRRAKRDGKRRRGGRDDAASSADERVSDRRTGEEPAAAPMGGGRSKRRKRSGGGRPADRTPAGDDARTTVAAAGAARVERDEAVASPHDGATEPSAAAGPEDVGAAATGAGSHNDNASRSGGAGGAGSMSDIPLTEQEPTAVDFVRGLVEAFGADADVSAEHVEDDDAIEIHVEGDDLGLLVGQRGSTLAAIAELTRTAVAQQHSGRLEGRLRVDIAGYRARRKEALIRFAGQVADKVKESGASVAMEPMSPPDRKIVHDAVNDIDGVHTSSRGEDRQRHVVIHPDD